MPLRCVSILLLALISLDSYGAAAPAGPPCLFAPTTRLRRLRAYLSGSRRNQTGKNL